MRKSEPDGLEELIDEARGRAPITPEELEDQARNFAVGNAAIECQGVTREVVDRVAATRTRR